MLPMLGVDDGSSSQTEERPFPCIFCESKFKKKQHLQNHQRIHTGEKYVCVACKKGFSRLHILKQHFIRKHLYDPCQGNSVSSGPLAVDGQRVKD